MTMPWSEIYMSGRLYQEIIKNPQHGTRRVGSQILKGMTLAMEKFRDFFKNTYKDIGAKGIEKIKLRGNKRRKQRRKHKFFGSTNFVQ